MPQHMAEHAVRKVGSSQPSPETEPAAGGGLPSRECSACVAAIEELVQAAPVTLAMVYLQEASRRSPAENFLGCYSPNKGRAAPSIT